MNNRRIRSIVEKTIKEIEDEYQEIQGLILTEDDLISIIFHKLSKNYPKVVKPQPTEDESIHAPMLHTELSWYDKNGKLTIKPDITILDPRYLSILHKNDERVNLPSKGCSFRGDAILMEIKFVKNKTGIRQATIDGPLRDDIQKIERLFKKLEDQGAPYDLFCYFIIFNKTDIKCREFERFQELTNGHQGGKYKMIYATGKVVFP